MKKELTIAVLILLMLASCQPYGKAIGTPTITTSSLNMQDIVAEAASKIQGDTLTLPNIYASTEFVGAAQKLQQSLIDEACKTYPALRRSDGSAVCGSTTLAYEAGATYAAVSLPSTMTQPVDTATLAPVGVGHAFYGMAVAAGSPDPSSRPDLETTALNLPKTTYLVGETINGQTEVENVGDYLATVLGWTKLDGTRTGPINYGQASLDPGQTSIGYFSLSAPTIPGVYLLTVSPQMHHDVWHPTAAISIGGPGTGYQGGDGTWVSESDLGNNEQSIQITVVNYTLPTGPYADLAIDLTTWDLMPPNPVVGGAANVLVDVKNVGTLTCNDGTITTYLNGVQINSYSLTQFVANLPPGQSARIGEQFQVTQPGSNQFRIVAECTDPADAIITNNEGIFSFNVYDQVDVSANKIQTTGGPYTDLDPVTLQLFVGNPGPTTATTEVYLYVDGNKEYEYTTTVQSGQQNVETYTVPPLSPGPHDITLVVDPNDLLFETNELNNVKLLQLSVASSAQLPDLELQKLEVTPATITEGETATLNIELKNTGTAAAPAGGSYTIEWVGGSLVSMQLPEILPGQVWTHTETYPSMQAGTYTILFDADAGVAESDYANNNGSVTFTVQGTPKPDYGISAVMTPAAPTKNDQINLDVTITNFGPVPTPQQTEYHVVVDNVLVDEITVPVIGTIGGAIGSGTFTSTAIIPPLTPGQHDITLKVDPNNQVVEGNEYNNEWSQTVMIPAPDLVVSVVMTPVAPTSTSQINLDVAITNIGNEPTTQQTEYHVVVDNVLVDEITVPVIGTIGGAVGSGTVTSTAIIGPQQPGSHTLEIRVDPNNQIIELDENNNNWLETILIPGAGAAYIYLQGAKITYPSLTGPTFVVGTCADPQVEQMLGASTCSQLEQGDGIIKAFPNYPGLGWAMVISGGTAQDVSNMVDLFIDIDMMGPDEIYDELNVRMPIPIFGLEMYANYYDSTGQFLHYLHYLIQGNPLMPIGMPIQLANNDLPTVFGTAASDIEIVYDWDPALQKWESYSGGVPSDLSDVDRFNGYFLVMGSTTPHDIRIYDVQDQGGAVNVDPGRMLFTPTKHDDLMNYAAIFDLTQPVYCQTPTAGPPGWTFQQVPPGPIDIGQSCWVTTIGGVLQ
ncbi:hypothetical protein KY329_01755 [Candidatus Woesearchaeota archaeon]|nr:hypothetical protein [Candidatus Woesearchaeota archaeon]